MNQKRKTRGHTACKIKIKPFRDTFCEQNLSLYPSRVCKKPHILTDKTAILTDDKKNLGGELF